MHQALCYHWKVELSEKRPCQLCSNLLCRYEKIKDHNALSISFQSNTLSKKCSNLFHGIIALNVAAMSLHKLSSYTNFHLLNCGKSPTVTIFIGGIGITLCFRLADFLANKLNFLWAHSWFGSKPGLDANNCYDVQQQKTKYCRY